MLWQVSQPRFDQLPELWCCFEMQICVPDESFLRTFAIDLMNMVKSYFEDAKRFYEKNDLINALSALNYSYGWLDSGVRLGIIEGNSDNRLCTLCK